MAPLPVETYPEFALKNLYMTLEDKDDWDNPCELCKLPTLLDADVQGNRIHGACTRNQEITEDDITKEWTTYNKKMKAVRSQCKEELRSQNLENKVDNMGKNIEKYMTAAINEMRKGTINKLIKPAKVPSWTKGMKLTPFIKSIEVWLETNKDLPDHLKYNKIIESLKLNKEIEGLS